MSYAQMGLLVIAVAFLLRRKLGLEFHRCTGSTIVSLGLLLLVIVIDGFHTVRGDEELLIALYVVSAAGWFALLVSLILASSAFRAPGGEAGDDAAEDRAAEDRGAREREEIRREIRERFDERDRDIEK